MKTTYRAYLQNTVIAILFALNAFAIYSILVREKNPINATPNTDYAVNSLLKALKHEYLSNGIMPILNDNMDSIFILTLQAEHLIVLRISDKQCESCSIEALADFKRLSETLNTTRLIITDFHDPRTMDSFKAAHKYANVLNISELSLPVEEINSPYMFLLDNKLKTSMTFVHQKEFPEKTESYFNALQKQLD
jgi:hypothetical protein